MAQNTAALRDDDGEVVLSDEERAHVIPWRGSSMVDAERKPLPLPASLLTQLRAVMPKVKARIAAHPGTASPKGAARMERVYTWSTLADLDVDLAATSLALFRTLGAGLEALVKLWIGAKDLSFALEAVTLGVERGLILDHDEYPSKLVDGVVGFDDANVDEETRTSLRDGALRDSFPTLRAMRDMVAHADEASYANACATATRLLKEAPPAASIALAFIFSEEAPLVAEVAERVMDKTAPEPELLFASLRDSALARRLAEARAPSFSAESPAAWTMIARLGPEAGSVLATVVNATESEELVPLLRAVHTPASFRALLRFVSKKKLAAPLQKLLCAHPAITLAAIEPVLARPKHEDRAVAAALLGALRPHIEKGAGRATKTETPTAATDAGDLPSFLATPAWSKARTEKVAPVVALEPIVLPTTQGPIDACLAALGDFAEWGQGVVEHHLKEGARSRNDWEKEIEGDRTHGRVIDLTLMLAGPEDLALAEWNDASDQRRLYYPNDYYGGAFAVALAKRGLPFLPGLLKLLRLKPSGADRMPLDVLSPVLMTFDGSELAELVLDELDSGKKFRAFAEEWALAHPRAMVTEAIPRAVGPEKHSANAVAILRVLVARGHAELVNDIAAKYESRGEAHVKDALDARVGTDPLDYVPAKLPKLPPIFDPESLPPIVLRSGGVIPPAIVRHVGTMLAFSLPEAPYAGLRRLREVCTAESLRDFSWALFEVWLATGAPPKEMWMMHALGHLGDDETVRRLVPMIRAWPGERAAARAVEALAVLANIASDLALMSLNGIAEKVRFASIQTGAIARMVEIAKARGLTRDELADRLVPDLGLDPTGELTLDYGSRTFVVTFDEHLSPVVLDSARKRLAALPKPTKNDDAIKAKEAQATFKALKKDVVAIARSRIDRLEQSMIVRRRWPLHEHRAFFVDKPIVFQLTRRLLWAAEGAGGDDETRRTLFRVDEERALVDEDDASLSLPDDARVGVVHPLELTSEERARWAQRFADYELLPPFEQLSREVFIPTEEERAAAALTSLEDRALPAPKLVFGLEAKGWSRWRASDGGSFSGHSKVFVGTPFTAHVEYEGAVGMGYIEEGEMLTLRRVTFSRDKEEGVVIGTVDPILISEVLRDLRSLLGA